MEISPNLRRAIGMLIEKYPSVAHAFAVGPGKESSVGLRRISPSICPALYEKYKEIDRVDSRKYTHEYHNAHLLIVNNKVIYRCGCTARVVVGELSTCATD